MPLIVTGTIGIDTVHAPTGTADAVLGGSCTYFAAAASFFTPVRIVAAVGGDWPPAHRAALERFPNVSLEGLELRKDSQTFAWGGKYHEDMNVRETLYTRLGVLTEAPPKPPESYRDSQYVFLANSHPVVQRDLLGHFPGARLVVADTMDLWIDTANADLKGLLKLVDGLVLNDQEARQLTGKRNNISAGRAILDMGPSFAVIKKGEHGCLLVHRDGLAALPAYPAETVVDPTGAGDSFAGGMMGEIAAEATKRRSDGGTQGKRGASFETVRRSLASGTVIASFTIESFSLNRLAALKREELDARMKAFAEVVRVG